MEVETQRMSVRCCDPRWHRHASFRVFFFFFFVPSSHPTRNSDFAQARVQTKDLLPGWSQMLFGHIYIALVHLKKNTVQWRTTLLYNSRLQFRTFCKEQPVCLKTCINSQTRCFDWTLQHKLIFPAHFDQIPIIYLFEAKFWTCWGKKISPVPFHFDKSMLVRSLADLCCLSNQLTIPLAYVLFWCKAMAEQHSLLAPLANYPIFTRVHSWATPSSWVW